VKLRVHRGLSLLRADFSGGERQSDCPILLKNKQIGEGGGIGEHCRGPKNIQASKRVAKRKGSDRGIGWIGEKEASKMDGVERFWEEKSQKKREGGIERMKGKLIRGSLPYVRGGIR